jgi:hypothetical protein
MRFVVLVVALSLLKPTPIHALPDPRPLTVAGVQLDRKKCRPAQGALIA